MQRLQTEEHVLWFSIRFFLSSKEFDDRSYSGSQKNTGAGWWMPRWNPDGLFDNLTRATRKGLQRNKRLLLIHCEMFLFRKTYSSRINPKACFFLECFLLGTLLAGVVLAVSLWLTSTTSTRPTLFIGMRSSIFLKWSNRQVFQRSVSTTETTSSTSATSTSQWFCQWRWTVERNRFFSFSNNYQRVHTALDVLYRSKKISSRDYCVASVTNHIREFLGAILYH